MSLEAVTQKLMNVIVDTRDFIDTRVAEVITRSSILGPARQAEWGGRRETENMNEAGCLERLQFRFY